MCLPEVLRDPEKGWALKARLEQYEALLAEKTERWVELAD